MFITNSGESMEGGLWQFLGQVTPAVAVSSITFSGLNGDNDRLYAIKAEWSNPATGAVKLLFQPNTSTPPQGSAMAKEELEVVTGIRADGGDANFSLADLSAAQANTFAQVVAFFATQTQGADGSPLGRVFQSRGFANDAVALGTRQRFFKRSGFWNDITTVITSITLAIDTDGSALGAGSDFRIFKVQ